MTDTPSLNQQFAAEIRAELGRRNVDQAVFARQCGWTPSSFSRRMTGQIPFSTEDIEKIAMQLGVQLEQLIWPVQR